MLGMAKNAAPKTPKIIMKIVMVFGRIWKCMKYLEKKGDNDIQIYSDICLDLMGPNAVAFAISL